MWKDFVQVNVHIFKTTESVDRINWKTSCVGVKTPVARVEVVKAIKTIAM
jgi:hypothetical protein